MKLPDPALPWPVPLEAVRLIAEAEGLADLGIEIIAGELSRMVDSSPSNCSARAWARSRSSSAVRSSSMHM